MNRLISLFNNKHRGILNIYVTAGYPKIDDTASIILALEGAGVDIIELGIPYSDPLADGTTIQESSAKALANGIKLKDIFNQVREARQKGASVPIVLMGYYNQMLQFGPAAFLEEVKACGVDGLIIPDLPMDIYQSNYQQLMESRELCMSFLITPDTSEDRIRQADRLSKGFIYMVSQSSITGKTGGIATSQIDYFNRIKSMELKTPRLIGFGIHNYETFSTACAHANGAIVGSAFIRHLGTEGTSQSSIHSFIKKIKEA